MSSTKPSKFDFSVNPVYQIDWQHEASGKRVAATKRRVKFRFGFSNREAIEQGMTGTDCRGEEHEVVLVWSLTSGKRLVVADGQEIHFSSGKMTDNMFETSWSIAGGHIIKIIAHAAPPLVNKPGFRQFDLLIDGLSFFDMPKIFELGKRRGNRCVSAPTPTSHFALPLSADERYVKDRSYAEPSYPRSRPEPVSVTPEFATRRAPLENRSATQDFAVQQQHARTFQNTQAPPALVYTQAPPAPVYIQAPTTPSEHTQAPTPVQQPDSSWWTQSHPERDEFAPVPPSPPTFAERSFQILNAYTPSPSVPVLMNTPYYSDYDSASPAATASDVSDYEEDSISSPVLKPTMKPITIAELLDEREGAPKNELDRAMESLVNLDDITRSLETPEQARAARRLQEKKMANKEKSNPLAAKAPHWQLGPQPSLKEIKKHSVPKEPTKEIMRTHAFDPNAVHAGMMVLYGSSMSSAPGYAVVHPGQNGHYTAASSHHAPYAYRAY